MGPRIPHPPTSSYDAVRVGVAVHARAKLPTRHGVFELVSFVDATGRRLDDVALVFGAAASLGEQPVAVRVHSECVTGDVFGSLRCDCGEQLQRALAQIVARGRGVLLYMRQEGRGIGIANKVAAYALQDAGMDTVEANLHLGFDDDLRSYDTAGAMLRVLGVRSVELFTNNPSKVDGLARAGLEIVRRAPIVMPVRAENAGYLLTKRVRSGHLLGDEDAT
jgi:GTP cyclohydrolase II